MTVNHPFRPAFGFTLGDQRDMAIAAGPLDPARAMRVAEAILKMVKFHIASLEAAAHG